jgi:phosphate transport system protein
MRSKFDGQMTLLHRELTDMGAKCQEAIQLVAQALFSGDLSLVSRITSVDREIDQMERDIEGLCMRLLLQQQPVARDLRQISAALKMITDMERIGDQAEDIGEIISELSGQLGQEQQQLCRMAEATIQMVTGSVDAYVKENMTLAQQVISYDDIVDRDFAQIKAELIQVIAQEPEQGETALDLLMIAKYFERIGDHAVNIAEWVLFSILGHHREDGTASER